MQFLTTTESYISLFFTLALMLVMLYFMIYRPQKKQEKKDAAMRSSLEIGDQVTTIGGVIGRVVAIKDDTFVLETGADRVKIRFTKNAISSAVCLGSFLSGLLMAILQKGKGLVWGAAEGVLFAGLLFILGTLYQSEWETMQFVRAGLVLLMGVLGGILGMLRAERKRR